ncbi:hypothetical protein ABK040_012592 [Willaertia magna]
MPAYHSQFNSTFDGQVVCATAILPIKTKVKGIAPKELDNNKEDIIDETLKFFKANMLFRSFSVEGTADRTLIYLTLYTHYLLKNVENKKITKRSEADKLFYQLSQDTLPGPGDKDFFLGAFYENPKNNQEKTTWESYIKQCKEELGYRLLPLLFKDDASGPDKFWMQFSKRKFLGKSFMN